MELWRGSALEGFSDYEFAQIETARLEELRLTVVGDRIEADLRAGRAGELVGELESLCSLHPLREGFVGQVMLAHYHSGRPADALRAYERFRRHVGEELGIEPSPELRRLEEQVLLHDSRIRTRVSGAGDIDVITRAVQNPFKGLRAFYESDNEDFFGRDRLIASIVRRIEDGERLIALVGPSGSGKSSVVRAGLIPALRKGAVPGSERWAIAEMVPGSRPFAELEVALLRSSLDAPDSLAGQLAEPADGVLRAALRMVPGDDSRLVLVIDQFDELFTLVTDDDERSRFISNLLPVLDDAHGRITVVLTLRADFYDRPLAFPEFGNRLGDGVVNVVPLTPDELEEAAQKPMDEAGVRLAPALLASLLTDVLGQPGALPLFQYTLTELFDRRVSETLTLDDYHSIGGLRGALTRRAEELFSGLEAEQQAATKQLFLRLVTIVERDEWGRRRVPASEIVSLDVDLVAVQGVVELFTEHRLLTVDRDFVTGSPTVEVAHEALLTEWDRLTGWIEGSRKDVERHAALTSAMNEWIESECHPDFLLTGSRLEGYKQWAATATMGLTSHQQQYLDASSESEEQDLQLAVQRSAREEEAKRSARRRLWAVATVALLVVGLVVGLFVLRSEPQPDRAQVMGVTPSDEIFGTGRLIDASGAAATANTPLPDFEGAVNGDDGAERLPLGAVTAPDSSDRLDFLREVCFDPDFCFRDADVIVRENNSAAFLTQAGRPFHVQHGFINESEAPLDHEFDVVLYVYEWDWPSDRGTTYRYTSDYVLRGTTDQCGPTYRSLTEPVTCEWFVHEFPEGLPEGRHAVWAFWEAPCWAWLDYAFVASCTDPDEVMALFASGADQPWQ